MNTNIISSKLEEIYNCIKDHTTRQPQSNSEYQIGLLDGNYGVLLFLAYYAKFTGNKAHKDRFDEYLDYSIDVLTSKDVLSQSYCSGITGILYVLNHLNVNKFTDIDISEAIEMYENYLKNRMLLDFQQENYDFFYGGLGPAFLFLELNKTEYLSEAIDILNITAIRDKNTIKWKSMLFEDKTYNICLSHGMSALVIFLSKCLDKGINPNKCKRLLAGVVNYFLSQEIDDKNIISSFPSISKECEPEKSMSRLGWCYGDLGVALALLYAGKTLSNDSLIAKSIEIFKKTTIRSKYKDTRIEDASICHGSAGVAQFYHRLFEITSVPEFKESYEYWIDSTIEMGLNQSQYAGYKQGEKSSSNDMFALLEGISGVGLTLIAACSADKSFMYWDQILLLR